MYLITLETVKQRSNEVFRLETPLKKLPLDMSACMIGNESTVLPVPTPFM